jgi:four helix bundle protein
VSLGDEIEERLIAFAVRIIRLTSGLPSSVAGRHVAQQLMRSDTSPAPNYAEARNAESRRDFAHKLRICLKELNESRIWLAIIRDSAMLPEPRLHEIIVECDELCRIVGASVRTIQQSKRHNNT